LKKPFNYDDFLFHADSLAKLDIPTLRKFLKKNHFAFVRGLISRQEVMEARKKLRADFKPSRDRPASGETPREIMGIFQKLSAGGVSPNQKVSAGGKKSHGVLRPRFMRTLYTPFWKKDVYRIHSALRQVCRVRNLLHGLAPEFCIDRPEAGLWSAARIHHYPRGGGFLVAHRDEALPALQRAKSWGSYYQAFLVMSERGKDFERGGAFIEKGKTRFYFEDVAKLGDIGIYDGQTLHGVEDIDPHRKLEIDTLSGRLAAFVSLYLDLT
jgi:hypothetical protein